ncbi:MAG: 30S ribosomal protein S17 [Lentisphaeraceae bacterium]|nr:30S ribosomal protein S17 [Lentisphaeraceae bacterium]
MSESVVKSDDRGMRKERTGVVTSDKMDKTIVVTVERLARHKRYKKVIKISKKYYAHDEKSAAKVGDEVLITETRPTSKLKRWRLVEVLKSAE